MNILKDAYSSICKHTIYRDIDSTVVITTNKLIAELIDSPTALVTENNLQDVASFYMQDFSKIKRTIATTEDSISDVIKPALLSNTLINIHDINANLDIINTINIPEMSRIEKNLLAVKYSNNPENEIWLSCALIAKQIPLDFTFNEAVAKIQESNSKLNKEFVERVLNKQLDKMRSAVKKSKTIDNSIKVDSVSGLAEKIKNEKGIFIIKTPTGSGKTTSVFEPLMSNAIVDNKKALYVSHRRSIVNSTMLDENIAHYEAVKPGTEQKLKALKVVVNSTIKENLSEFLESTSLMCIDEASQVLDHVLLGSVDNRLFTFDKLVQLIENTDTVVLADADANNDLLELIGKTNRTDITIFEMKADHSDIKLNITDADSIHTEITATVASGRRSLIAMDNKRNAEILSAGLRKEFSEKNILTITRDSIDGTAQQNWLKNPNLESLNYDAVIYSPVITSSVSITSDVFEENFGIFSGVLAPSDCIQMLRRDRTAKIFTVGLQNPKETNFQETNMRNALKDRKSISEVNNFDRLTMSISITKQIMKSNFCGAFCYNAELDNFEINIIRAEKEHKKESFKLRKSMSKIEEKEYKECILSATALSPIDVKKARDQDLELDQNTAYSLQRFEIEKCLVKKEIDETDIKLYGRGALKSILKNIEITNMSEVACNNKDKKEECIAFQDKTFYATRNRFYKMILSTLEIDLKKGGKFTNDKAKEVLKSLHSEKIAWNSLNVMSARKSWKDCSRATSTVNAILEKIFGIKTTSKDSNKKGDRQRLYVVQMPKLNRINEVLSRRSSAFSGKVVSITSAEIRNYTSSEAENV